MPTVKEYHNAPFPNLSWLGRQRYRVCQRQWYYAHAATKIDNKEERHWALYRESRLAPEQTIVGYAVDNAITDALRGLKRGEAWPSHLAEIATNHVDGYLQFSQAWTYAVNTPMTKWPKSRYQPIDRIFYGEQFTVVEIADMKERAANCANVFQTSDVFTFIQSVDASKYVAPPEEGEGIPWTTIDGVPVYTKYDFIIRDGDDTIVFDWKTGKLTEFSDKKAMLQLHLYSLYAENELGAVRARTKLAPVWLSVSGKLELFTADEAKCAELIREIHEIYDTLNTRMGNRQGNLIALEADFAMTTDLRACERCLFRSCTGYDRVKALTAESDDPFKDE